MNFTVKQGSVTQQSCDVLIVNLFQGVKLPGGATAAVDKALDGAISELIREEEFEGRLGETLVIRACEKMPAKKVLLVGLGKREGFDILQIMRAAASGARKCREMRAKSVASTLHGAGATGIATLDCAKALVLGTILGTSEHAHLKTENVKQNSIESFEIVELSAEKSDDVEEGVRRAEILGDAIIFARDLANEPSNIVTPTYLADAAEKIAAESGMECRIKDRKGIEDAGLGLLAAVARGSAAEPRFIELAYQSSAAERTVAVIGKGITFDAGGYSLKPSDKMYGMNDDMSGAGAVLAAMRAVGRLKPLLNVVALIPAAENMIGAGAIHPGDVFKSHAGRTVEVADTDAEGRLTLADAVSYARKLGVDEIVDVATLTSACVVALGRRLSGIMGNDQELVNRLIQAGKSCGEKLWQLPLETDYADELASDVADIRNVVTERREEAGATIAALFIESFTGGMPWAHIDLSSVTIDEDTHLARKGSTGAGTGTLTEYLLWG